MISNIKIKNYKSIDTLDFNLGRVNVFIGENGAGKSNILEAIALAGAAASDKLDNEFLASRGIRVTRPEYMRAAFPGFGATDSILIDVGSSDVETISFKLTNDNQPYSKWRCQLATDAEGLALSPSPFSQSLRSYVKEMQTEDPNPNSWEPMFDEWKALRAQIFLRMAKDGDTKTEQKSKRDKNNETIELNIRFHLARYMAFHAITSESARSLQQFIIYSPENSALRTFQREGQIEPLGINGEGLLRLMSVLHADKKYQEIYSEIRQSLKVLGWFDDLEVVKDDNSPAGRFEIKDRYLDDARRNFDQLSTNEGFLYLAFYFALFSCDLTPSFFAIDNIDASLNPKLCSLLTQQLVKLAKTHDKQVIMTTHNPAILDGLNLDDDDQRLYVVSRNRQGYTRLKRIQKKNDAPTPVKLSEAFLRGSLGGLPKGF